jgi:hypothetical protein
MKPDPWRFPLTERPELVDILPFMLKSVNAPTFTRIVTGPCFRNAARLRGIGISTVGHS